MKRPHFYADFTSDKAGNIQGPLQLPADGTFVLESLAVIVEHFAESQGKTPTEVSADLHGFMLLRSK